LNAKDQALKERLSKLSGAAFDRTYMAEMVKDHEADLTELHKQATTAQDSEIKGWASNTATVVEGHLKLARSIHRSHPSLTTRFEGAGDRSGDGVSWSATGIGSGRRSHNRIRPAAQPVRG
jgi:hypothetical protein